MSILLLIFSLTYHTVPIDGHLDNFHADELIYLDSRTDSYWQGNELYGVYLTWDASNLYLGLSYKVQNNAVLLVLDPQRNRGVSDINNLDWYPRNFQFYGMKADIFCALWNADLSTGGVREILAKDRTQPLQGVEVINIGSSGDSSALMLKIPFSVIYGLSAGVPSYATLKLVALLTGSDHSMGADAIPDNEGIGSSSAIRTFLQIQLDENGDSIPDDSIDVRESTKIVTYPKKPLVLADFSISPRKVYKGVPLRISFRVSEYSFAKVYVYSEQGKKVFERHYENLDPDVENTLIWQVADNLPQGVYYVIINVKDIIREKKAFFIKK